MTCSEFQQVLPDVVDGEVKGEQAAHLRMCGACSSLVADLRAIASGAKLLSAADEPSPRVWANLERTLETEGLIRTPRQAGGVLVPARKHWFSVTWLVPAVAVLVLGVGLLLRNSRSANTVQQVAQKPQTPVTASPHAGSPVSSADADDELLLAHVSPAVRARYEDTLRNVNAFIDDAQASLNENPNDEEARLLLMDAYSQKTMVYELAMDRSLQ